MARTARPTARACARPSTTGSRAGPRRRRPQIDRRLPHELRHRAMSADAGRGRCRGSPLARRARRRPQPPPRRCDPDPLRSLPRRRNSAAPIAIRCNSMSDSAMPTSACRSAIRRCSRPSSPAMEEWDVPITLLHCYPFVREAAFPRRGLLERLSRYRRHSELHRPLGGRGSRRGDGADAVLQAALFVGRVRPRRAAFSRRHGCSATPSPRCSTAGCSRPT